MQPWWSSAELSEFRTQGQRDLLLAPGNETLATLQRKCRRIVAVSSQHHPRPSWGGFGQSTTEVNLRFHQRAGAALLAAGLLVPAGAVVATSANAATTITAHQGHGKMKPKVVKCVKAANVDYRTATREARKDKKAAYRMAQKNWREATVVQRAARALALEAATTKEERAEIRAAFRAATSDERMERKEARVDARTEYRAALKQARMDFRADKKECRK